MFAFTHWEHLTLWEGPRISLSWSLISTATSDISSTIRFPEVLHFQHCTPDQSKSCQCHLPSNLKQSAESKSKVLASQGCSIILKWKPTQFYQSSHYCAKISALSFNSISIFSICMQECTISFTSNACSHVCLAQRPWAACALLLFQPSMRRRWITRLVSASPLLQTSDQHFNQMMKCCTPYS